MLAHVDLCSGIGGFALGFQRAGLSHPVLFCDIEPWSRQVLAKHWPDVPIAEDVKELASDPGRLVPDCDILTAGYPCQPFSQAGVRRGEEDDRHIWPEIFTIVETKLPRWCVFENVSGHISLGLDQVLSDLESKGYAVQPFVVPACAVDAPHRRDRVWIIAAHADRDGEPDDTINAKSGCWELGQPTSNDPDSDSQRSYREEQHQHGSGQPTDRQERELGSVRQVLAGRGDAAERSAADVGNSKNNRRDRWPAQARRERASDQSDKSKLGLQGEFGRSSKNVADTDGQRRRGGHANRQVASDVGQPSRRQRHDARRVGAGVTQPSVGGMADGLSTWLDEPRDIPRIATGVKQRAARLKGLGNAIVPQIAMQIGLTIKAVEHG